MLRVCKQSSAIIANTKYGEPAICKQAAAGRNEDALEEVAEEGEEEEEEEEEDVDDVEDEEEEDEEEEEGAEPAEAVSDNDKRVSENDKRARLLEQELLKRLEEKKQSLRDRSRVGKRSSSLTVEQGLLEQQQWTLQQRLVDQEFEQLRGQLDMNRVLDA